jgi:hypothetical protein
MTKRLEAIQKRDEIWTNSLLSFPFKLFDLIAIASSIIFVMCLQSKNEQIKTCITESADSFAGAARSLFFWE